MLCVICKNCKCQSFAIFVRYVKPRHFSDEGFSTHLNNGLACLHVAEVCVVALHMSEAVTQFNSEQTQLVSIAIDQKQKAKQHPTNHVGTSTCTSILQRLCHCKCTGDSLQHPTERACHILCKLLQGISRPRRSIHGHRRRSHGASRLVLQHCRQLSMPSRHYSHGDGDGRCIPLHA